jgi:hypothetical protein
MVARRRRRLPTEKEASVLTALPLLAILTASPLTPVHYPALDALIARTGERFDAQVKGSMAALHRVSVHVEELDSDGKVEHVEDQVLEATGKGSTRQFVLISAKEDGKDVTAERKAKHDSSQGRRGNKSGHSVGHHGLSDINPFAASERGHYLIWAVAPLPNGKGPVHLHFKPPQPTKDRFEGDAWVDPASGAIEEIQVAPSELPMLVDVLTVHAKLDAAKPDGRATELDMEAGGHLLFWGKHARIHLTFDYAANDPT